MNTTDLSSEPAKLRCLRDLLFSVFICITIFLAFAADISGGKTLSKFSLLSVVDHWQNQKSEEPFVLSDDPSASLQHIPNEVFGANAAAGGEIPLWNPLSGGGRPFIAEFQTLTYSIFHNYFPFRSWADYNNGLFFRLFLQGLGAYFLCRRFQISCWPSFAAACSFMLCPRSLRWLELCSNFCFFPWLMLVFLWMAAKPSFLRAALCAGVTAACAYNMHPETFACAVVASAVLTLDEFCKNDRRNSGSISLRTFGNCIVWNGIVALISILLVAPLLIPFLEFVANSSSYKFDGSIPAFIPTWDYIADLCLPVSELKYFCGTVLGLLLPLGIVVFWRQRKALILCFFANLLFCVRPGVLEQIFSVQPFVLMLPEYPLASCLLFQSVVAAAAMDEFFLSSLSQRRRLWVVLPLAAIFALVCLGQTALGAETWCRISDLAYAKPQLPLGLLVSSALVLTLVAVLCFSGALRRKKAICIAFLSLANTGLMIAAIPLEFVAGKKESYRSCDYLGQVQSTGARMVTTGYDAFQANTNLVYGINDFRVFAPIHPRRYQHFAELAGIRGKFCFLQTCPTTFNHLFDLASIKYVLSDSVLESTGGSKLETGQQLNIDAIPVKLAEGLIFKSAQLCYSEAEQVLRGQIFFVLPLEMTARYSCRLALCDESGKAIFRSRWPFDAIDQSGTALSRHVFRLQVALPVPLKLKAGDRVFVKLFIRDNWLGTELATNTLSKEGLLLGNFKFGDRSTPSNQRFIRLSDETDGFSLYENTSALAAAYLASAAKVVSGEKESLAALSDPNFDWRHSVIIESKDADGGALAVKTSGSSALACREDAKDFARILDRSADSVLIFVSSRHPAYLVLTDTVFPGWKATVDGHPTPIMVANHAFRAVSIPQGTHRVLFNYLPESYSLGLILFKTGLCFVFLLLVLGFIQDLLKSRDKIVGFV